MSRTFSRLNLREVLAIVVRNNVQTILWSIETNIYTKRQIQQQQLKPTLFLESVLQIMYMDIDLSRCLHKWRNNFCFSLTECTAILDQVGRRMWTDLILFFFLIEYIGSVHSLIKGSFSYSLTIKENDKELCRAAVKLRKSLKKTKRMNWGRRASPAHFCWTWVCLWA